MHIGVKAWASCPRAAAPHTRPASGSRMVGRHTVQMASSTCLRWVIDMPSTCNPRRQYPHAYHQRACRPPWEHCETHSTTMRHPKPRMMRQNNSVLPSEALGCVALDRWSWASIPALAGGGHAAACPLAPVTTPGDPEASRLGWKKIIHADFGARWAKVSKRHKAWRHECVRNSPGWLAPSCTARFVLTSES